MERRLLVVPLAEGNVLGVAIPYQSVDESAK